MSILFAQSGKNLHDFSAKSISGEDVSLSKYKGNVVLVVNTASKCGLTPQYEGLETLYKKFKDKNFEILGFPCNQFAGQEPGTSEEIIKFCTGEYGVTFQMFDKVDVRDKNAHPIFKYLVNNTEYKGFDLNTDMGKRFQGFLSKKFPEILKGKGIKWNFTKFLVDKNGNVLKRYEPTVKPEEITSDIEKLL
ncbi:MAG: glutathione peroxidase [Rhodothermaceae bacterium]